jgi:hypothetical protein
MTANALIQSWKKTMLLKKDFAFSAATAAAD